MSQKKEKCKFTLRISLNPPALSSDSKPWEKRKSLAHTLVQQEQVEMRRKQIEEAVEWCTNTNNRGWAALKTGRFPLIVDARTINRRIDGNVVCGNERAHCRILTQAEEKMLVRHVANKNRCYQGMSRPDITEEVIKILTIRKELIRSCRGRKSTPLSANAKKVLDTEKLGKSFWKRWDTEHRSLTRKRPGNVSVKRALNCTEEMAITHLDALGEELVRLGIFIDAKKLQPGKWRGKIDLSRVFNHDETPQFVNYGVDPTSRALVYCGKGEESKNMISENRECVTIHPFVSLAGELVMCHVIFKGHGITNHMAPSEEVVGKIKNLLISSTENGVQTHLSLQDAYANFEEIIVKKGVKKPISVMSDGHSSRFDVGVLEFMEEHQNHIFIGPPDTTGLTQLLDQINQSLHSKYRAEKKRLFTQSSTINREGFMEILAEIWDTWAIPDAIIKAGKRVGISSEGLDIEWMQQDKFAGARLLLEEDPEPSNVNLVNSPQGVRKNSSAYYRHKFEQSEKLRCKLMEETLDVSKIPGVLKVDKCKKPSSTKVRITQQCGSMTAQKIVEKARELKEAAEQKEKKKQESVKKKQVMIEQFIRCKTGCSCNAKPCPASKLKQCPSCNDVMKSVCSKITCRKDDGSKPDMIRPLCSTSGISGSKRKREEKSDSSEEDESYHSDNYDEDDGSGDNEDRDSAPDEIEFTKVENEDYIQDLKKTWKSLSPPNKEKDLIGQWYAAIYATKQRKSLFVGKVDRRFLHDADGPVDEISLKCLKPKVGSGTVLEDTPQHLPPDTGSFALEDIIAGPLCVIQMKGLKYDVMEYEEVKKMFNDVKDLDRKTWLR